MSADDYAACFERIKRANVQIGVLKRAVWSQIAEDARMVKTEFDMHCIPEWEWVITAAPSPGSERRLTNISLRVSEIVNGLRATLDNLVWALSVLNHQPPPDPIPPRDPWRRVRFPITVTFNQWQDGAVPNALRFVDRRLHPTFKDLQPWVRRKRNPERDELRMLDELWNIDKHRRPLIVSIPMRLIGFGPDEIPPHLQGHSFEVVKRRVARPLVRRTEIARVREIKPLGHVMLQPELNPDYEVEFRVAFKQGPPAFKGPVLETLEACRDAVAEALTRFEPEFR